MTSKGMAPDRVRGILEGLASYLRGDLKRLGIGYMSRPECVRRVVVSNLLCTTFGTNY